MKYWKRVLAVGYQMLAINVKKNNYLLVGDIKNKEFLSLAFNNGFINKMHTTKTEISCYCIYWDERLR